MTRQRRIRRPAGLPRRRPATKKLAPNADERRPHEPVAEHVERGEGHVVGADHQRDQEVAERAGQDRDDHEEDHHRGVHREQHRVELGRDLAAFGREQQLARGSACRSTARPAASERPAPTGRRRGTTAAW